MALPVLADLKDYLRIETTAEDTTLTDLLTRAEGLVRHFVDRDIESDTRTYRIEGDSNRAWDQSLDRLLHPQPPLDPASVMITDRDGDEVDTDNYHVDGNTGVIRGLEGYRFRDFPFDIEADNGLAEASDYTVRVEPMLSEAILALAAMYYWQRNPNATGETQPGVSVTYQGVSMPLRTKEVICALRRVL